MAKITFDTKNPGDQHTSAEVNEVKTSVNALHDTVAEKAAAATVTAHTNNTSNPHGVTKSQLGLSNVDNTTDANKPVSILQQLALDNNKKVAYVATTGSDANSGTKGSPFLTVNKALEFIKYHGVIECAQGIYRQTVNLSLITGDVTIRAEQKAYVAFFGSTTLVLDKTDGQTNVYEGPLAAKPTGLGGSRGAPMIFQMETPSKPITAGEEHSLQMGKTHRLDYTEMLEVASIEDVDSNPGTWFWSGGTIYVSEVGGGDATLKQYEVRTNKIMYPFNGSTDPGGTLTLDRIETRFSSLHGIETRGLSRVTRYKCKTFGNYENGFADQAGSTITWFDETGGNGNDGINGTMPGGFEVLPQQFNINGTYFEAWSHDNYDDGISYHTRGQRSIIGGLFEKFGKAGIVDISGASIQIKNAVVRGGPAGIHISTSDPTGERAFTVANVFSTIVTNCTRGFRCGGSTQIMTLFDCEVRSCSIGYVQESSSTVNAYRCRHDGNGTVTSGTVNSVNHGFLGLTHVNSVNGSTGAVTINKGTVGLANVDNTSDANKPVSSAQGTAIAAKVNSVTAGEPSGSDVVVNVVSLTQAEYTAGTKVATTFYIITDA